MTGDTPEQLVERFFDAFGRLDADAAAALVAHDYEGYAVDEMPLRGEEGVYRGPDGIRRWVAETSENTQNFTSSVAHIRRWGDVLVAIGVSEVDSPAKPIGQVRQQIPFAAVIRVRDGLISTIHAYPRYDDAARAEGLPASEPDSAD